MAPRETLTEGAIRAVVIPVVALLLFDFGGMAWMWATLPFGGEMPAFLVDVATNLGKFALIGSAVELFAGRRLFPRRAIGAIGPEDLLAFLVYAAAVPTLYVFTGTPVTAQTVAMGAVIVALLLLIHSIAHYVGRWTPDRVVSIATGVQSIATLVTMIGISVFGAISVLRFLQLALINS